VPKSINATFCCPIFPRAIKYSVLLRRGKINKRYEDIVKSMDLRIPDKKFVCVDYPGIVESHDAMLQTLGGTSKVSQVKHIYTN